MKNLISIKMKKAIKSLLEIYNLPYTEEEACLIEKLYSIGSIMITEEKLKAYFELRLEKESTDYTATLKKLFEVGLLRKVKNKTLGYKLWNLDRELLKSINQENIKKKRVGLNSCAP